MVTYTYKEIVTKAIKNGIPNNKVAVGMWAKLNGYIKIKRIIKDNKFTTLYILKND